MSAFDKALQFTLREEGGYSNNPADHGHATDYGIEQATYDRYRIRNHLPLQSVKYITQDDARAIYQTFYWTPAHCGEMPDKLACVHFDTSVNCGVSGAAKMLQRALGVAADGVIGPHTLQAIQDADETDLIRQYLNERDEHYRAIVDNDHTQAVFLRGWLNRVSLLQKEYC